MLSRLPPSHPHPILNHPHPPAPIHGWGPSHHPLLFPSHPPLFEIHGAPRRSLGIHGDPLRSTEIHGDSHGDQWRPMHGDH